MTDRSREYSGYRLGCERLGQTPLDEAEFDARWQQLEEHAERLKEAEAQGTLSDLAVTLRMEMQQRVKEDPFIKAVLVGIGQEEMIE